MQQLFQLQQAPLLLYATELRRRASERQSLRVTSHVTLKRSVDQATEDSRQRELDTLVPDGDLNEKEFHLQKEELLMLRELEAGNSTGA